MKTAILVFPGTNREHDMAAAVRSVSGTDPMMVWHAETEIPQADLIILPGGFSYGDYLRSGAIAARSPIVADLLEKAKKGVRILGVCNGFQILTETGILPGALMRNAGLHFICKKTLLRVERADTIFTKAYEANQVVRCPVAHHDGNFFADDETLKTLEGDGRVLFRYCDADGAITPGRQYQRLAKQHCWHHECPRHHPWHDAASGKSDRRPAWRPRWPWPV